MSSPFYLILVVLTAYRYPQSPPTLTAGVVPSSTATPVAENTHPRRPAQQRWPLRRLPFRFRRRRAPQSLRPVPGSPAGRRHQHRCRDRQRRERRRRERRLQHPGRGHRHRQLVQHADLSGTQEQQPRQSGQRHGDRHLRPRQQRRLRDPGGRQRQHTAGRDHSVADRWRIDSRGHPQHRFVDGHRRQRHRFGRVLSERRRRHHLQASGQGAAQHRYLRPVLPQSAREQQSPAGRSVRQRRQRGPRRQPVRVHGHARDLRRRADHPARLRHAGHPALRSRHSRRPAGPPASPATAATTQPSSPTTTGRAA